LLSLLFPLSLFYPFFSVVSFALSAVLFYIDQAPLFIC
jgi:hypothetical protein